MEREGFFERVYDMVEQIPEGMVATYGQIARLVGEPRKARYVGFALHSNPRPGEVPCCGRSQPYFDHRAVPSRGVRRWKHLRRIRIRRS